MPCAFGHTSRDPLCDACDSESCDPNTGWGGFTDNFAKKHFDSDADQAKWYEERRRNGLKCERATWDDEE